MRIRDRLTKAVQLDPQGGGLTIRDADKKLLATIKVTPGDSRDPPTASFSDEPLPPEVVVMMADAKLQLVSGDHIVGEFSFHNFRELEARKKAAEDELEHKRAAVAEPKPKEQAPAKAAATPQGPGKRNHNNNGKGGAQKPPDQNVKKAEEAVIPKPTDAEVEKQVQLLAGEVRRMAAKMDKTPEEEAAYQDAFKTLPARQQAIRDVASHPDKPQAATAPAAATAGAAKAEPDAAHKAVTDAKAEFDRINGIWSAAKKEYEAALGRLK